jgi:hypothetical protein
MAQQVLILQVTEEVSRNQEAVVTEEVAATVAPAALLEVPSEPSQMLETLVRQEQPALSQCDQVIRVVVHR